MSDLVERLRRSEGVFTQDIIDEIERLRHEIERLRGMVDEIHAARAYLREQNRLLAQLAAVTRERDELQLLVNMVAEKIDAAMEQRT